MRKSRITIEEHSFQPTILKYTGETNNKKRLLARKLLKNFMPLDKGEHLRELIKHKKKEKEIPRLDESLGHAFEFLKSTERDI